MLTFLSWNSFNLAACLYLIRLCPFIYFSALFIILLQRFVFNYGVCFPHVNLFIF